MGVAAGEDDVGHLGLAAEDFGDDGGVEHLVADGVVDLVEDDEVPVAGEDCGGGLSPGLLDEPDVLRVGLGAADFDEAAAKLLDDEVVKRRRGGWVGIGCYGSAERWRQGFVEGFGGVQ